MALTNSDIIVADTSAIIGLLLLLTFSSIASDFVESETSRFFGEWYGLKNQILTTNELLIECKDLQQAVIDLKNDPDDDAAYNEFEDYLRNKFYDSNLPQPNERMIFRGTGDAPIDSVNGDMIEELLKRCVTLVPEGNEQITKLQVLTDRGLLFGYLDKNTDGDIGESRSMQERASGPLSINLVSLGMIFPFIISAILDAVFSHRRNDKNDHRATRGGLTFLVIGLGTLAVGLSLIGLEFYKTASPFLNPPF
jgi:hypothetical protein